jgi:hypothetical protein
MLDPNTGQIAAGTQNIDERIVKIEGGKLGSGSEESRRERPGPSAHFEHAISRSIDRQARDPRRRAGIHKEVLAQGFFWTQPASPK